MQLVDSHAHLDHLDDLDSALECAQDAGVTKIITVGTTIAESENAANLALSCSRPGLDIRTTGLGVYATAGIHPKDGRNDVERFGIDESIHRLKAIAQSSKKVVAIGECGLDYYLGSRGQRIKNSDEERKFQRVLFEAQIELAGDLNLPLVIHCRNGWDEIFDLLTMNHKRSTINGVFHSWTGDWEAAKKALDLGFYISFSGIVTFTNAQEIQEVAKKVPLDRFLVETDSPFLTPEPLRSAPFEESQGWQGKLGRGKTNEPKNVKMVCKFIADIRNESFDSISSKTSENARRLFQIS